MCRFSPHDCLKGLEMQRRGTHQRDVLTRALLTQPSIFSRKSWFSPSAWSHLPCTSRVVQGSELLVHLRVSSVFFQLFYIPVPSIWFVCTNTFLQWGKRKREDMVVLWQLLTAVKSAVPQGALGWKELDIHRGRESSPKGGKKVITHCWLQFPLSLVYWEAHLGRQSRNANCPSIEWSFEI